MNFKCRYISIFQNRYGDIIQLHAKHQILYGHIQKLYNHTYLTYEDSNHTTKCYYDNCRAFAKVLESTKSWNPSPQFFPLLISYGSQSMKNWNKILKVLPRLLKINIIYKCKTILKEILWKIIFFSQIKFNVSLQNAFAWIDI